MSDKLCKDFSWCFQTLDSGVNVIQLETAVGAAIKSFEGAIGVLKFCLHFIEL